MIRRETIHSMARRRNDWDYCAPGRYMVTLTLADRTRPWLGCLEKDGVRLLASELGLLIAEKWREIAANWPGVEVEEFVAMPDHIHGILHIARRQSHPLGQIVGSFKARSTSAARDLAGKPGASTRALSPPAQAPGVSSSRQLVERISPLLSLPCGAHAG